MSRAILVAPNTVWSRHLGGHVYHAFRCDAPGHRSERAACGEPWAHAGGSDWMTWTGEEVPGDLCPRCAALSGIPETVTAVTMEARVIAWLKSEGLDVGGAPLARGTSLLDFVRKEVDRYLWAAAQTLEDRATEVWDPNPNDNVAHNTLRDAARVVRGQSPLKDR